MWIKAALALAVALDAGAASGQQTLVHETEDGYFIYREPHSCVLYADFDSGTMIRVSHRIDQHRIYFTALNEAWRSLALNENRTISVHLMFNPLRRGHGTAGLVIRHPDGRMGYTGANISSDDFLDDFERSTEMVLLVNDEEIPGIEIERFPLGDSGHAVRLLEDCTERFFGSDRAD